VVAVAVPGGVGVVVAAAGAEQEAGGGAVLPGDADRLGTGLGLAEVQPGEDRVAIQAHPEPGAGRGPAAHGAGLVERDGQRPLELDLLALVPGVADPGATAAHGGVHAGEVDDVPVLAGVRHLGSLGGGAGRGRAAGLALGGQPAAPAERSRAQTCAVDADVPRAGHELAAVGVEVRAGGELGEGGSAGAGVGDGVVLPHALLVL